MKQLLVRSLNLAVIAAVLLGYNTVLDRREKEDQIAQLSAELETTKLQKESLEARPRKMQQRQRKPHPMLRLPIQMIPPQAHILTVPMKEKQKGLVE